MGSNMKSGGRHRAVTAEAHHDRRGHLERPFSSEPLQVPVCLSLEGSWLVSPDHGNEASTREVVPQVGLLSDFLALWDAADEKVLAYARRYGLLGIWENAARLGSDCADIFDASYPAWPWDQDDCLFPLPEVANTQVMAYYPLGWVDGRYLEHTEIWRHLARQASALLHISNRLHQGILGREEDWQTVFEWQIVIDILWRDLDVLGQWVLVRHVVGAWVRLGRVGVRIRPSASGECMVFSGESLFGALALQIASVISRGEGLAECCNCGLHYPPERVPAKDRRRYCPECRDRKVPQKHASGDHVNRRRQASLLSAQGLTPAEIAESLRKPEAQIRKWLGVDGHRRVD